MTSDTPELLRTSRNGCWQLKGNSWGQFLAPAADPLANVVLSDEQLKGFELNDDIIPIPAELWTRWIALCFHFAKERTGNLEVSCRFLRKEDDKSQWRLVVPPQEVGGASVHADNFDGSIDIVTGEMIEQWPPEGWLPCGSSHSHNTMQAFFSGTDDKYELGDPGLHIVVGSINLSKMTYTHKASITAHNRRFLIDTAAVVNLTPTSADYHPDVLLNVELHKPKPITTWPWPQHTQRWQRPDGFRNPNAGNGYSQITRYWEPDSDSWPIGWINDLATDDAIDVDDNPLPIHRAKNSIDALIHDAIDFNMEEHLPSALMALQSLINDRLEELELMDPTRPVEPATR